MERRNSERIPTRISLTCRVPASPHKATVHDLSRSGCKLEFADIIAEKGTTLSLEITDGSRIRGEVIWTSMRTVGVRFEQSLRQSTAIQLGLEQAPEVTVVLPEPTSNSPGGFLGHWVRQIIGSFAAR